MREIVKKLDKQQVELFARGITCQCGLKFGSFRDFEKHVIDELNDTSEANL